MNLGIPFRHLGLHPSLPAPDGLFVGLDQRVRPNLQTSNRRIEFPDRRIALPDRRTEFPDRRIALLDRRVALPDRRIEFPDRRVALPDRRIEFPDRRIAFLDRRIALLDRRIALPERRTEFPQHRIACADCCIALPERRTEFPQRRIACADCCIALLDRRVALPDGPVARSQVGGQAVDPVLLVTERTLGRFEVEQVLSGDARIREAHVPNVDLVAAKLVPERTLRGGEKFPRLVLGRSASVEGRADEVFDVVLVGSREMGDTQSIEPFEESIECFHRMEHERFMRDEHARQVSRRAQGMAVVGFP